jgi:LysR family transcriptional regulator for bpeEF and oprC
MDRFDTMLAFTRVVELKSFTQAAISLNLPKATVSAQVIALEKRLRVKLLNRTTRHVSLTPDGASYYERAVRLLGELEEAEATVRQAAISPKGRLRVEVPASIGRRVIAPALGDFFDRYPDIELEVGCNERPVDLVHENIDCMIRTGQNTDESLLARQLGEFRMKTYAAPSYLVRYGRPASLEDVQQHDCIVFASPRTGQVRPFVYEDAKEGSEATLKVQGRRRVVLDDLDSCAAAACAGVGLIQLADFIADELVAGGKLAPVLEQHLSPKIPVLLLYPPNRHLSTRVRAFAEWSADLFTAVGCGLPA